MSYETELLLADLGAAVRRHHTRRRNRRGILAATLVLAALTASLAVAGTYGDWWTDAAPAVHQPQVTEAMAESSIGPLQPDLSEKATVARTDRDELVAVATTSGGFCLTAFRDDKGIGSSCSSEPAKPDGAASVFMTRASYPLDRDGNPLPADGRYWVAYGRITDASASSLDLSSVGLSSKIPLARGGFFLFDIPANVWSAADGAHGPAGILDASGKQLRTACVNVGIAPGKAWSGGGFLGDGPGDCAHGYAGPPRPDLAQAQVIAERTLGQDEGIWRKGTTIALWQAPLGDGRICTFWALPAPQPVLDTDENGLPLTVPNGAHPTSCGKPGSWPFAKSVVLAPGVDETWVRDHYSTTVDIRVRPGSGITKVVVAGADGTLRAATAAGDEYVAELPPTPRVGKGPGPIPGGPYRAIGYDASGAEVAGASVPESAR